MVIVNAFGLKALVAGIVQDRISGYHTRYIPLLEH